MKKSLVALAGLAVVGGIALLMRDTGKPVEASAQIEIAAPLETVWSIQVGFEKWGEWNPEIESMELKGPVAPGTEFVWTGGGVPITSTIREVVPNQRIVWSGKAPGLDAVHSWEFSQKGDKILVVTKEHFSGPLAWLMPGTMRRTLETTLANSVRLLKREALRQAGGAMAQ